MNRQNRNLALVTVLCAATAVPAVAAPTARLLPARPGDLVPSAVVAAPAQRGLATSEDAPVQFSWPLAAEADLAPRQAAFQAESREHWLRFTGAELARGVPVATTAPGALVRLNPAAANTAAAKIEPASLRLRDAAGSEHGVAAFDQIATAEQLAAAGASFPAGTLALRLRPEVGAGRLTLTWAAGSQDPAGVYVLHVFDRESPAALTLAADRPAYLDGEALTVHLALQAGAERLAVAEASAFVTSPAGRAWPLAVSADGKGGLVGRLTIDAREPFAPGLWEVEVQASGSLGGLPVLRNARTAFAATLPTARLSGAAQAVADDAAKSGVAVRFGVEVASAGRYEVRGVLYGTDPSGNLRPMAAAASASRLEAGAATLELRFEASALAGGALQAPFEVRQLELRDQGRLALLEQRARGAVVKP